MNRSIYLYLLFTLLTTGMLAAQTKIHTEWASKVIEASSELSPREFSAPQALGTPNVTPGSGNSPNAWMPHSDDRVEYIKLGFEENFRVKQIAIVESVNPGAISAIFIYDKADNEFLLNTFQPEEIPLDNRILHVFFDLTDFNVSAVKIVFNLRVVNRRPGIDAVAISNSTVPVRHEMLISESAIVSVNPERLSETINSIYNELRPIVTPDGKTLLFSRKYHPGNVGGIDDEEDIWYSQWDEEKGEWMEAVNIGPPLNTPGPNFISSLTPDGNTGIFTLGNRYGSRGKMRSGVSIVTRNENGWSKPVPLEIENLTNVSERANFFLANNRQVMIMAVEEADSYGGRDLYVSFLQSNGKWSTPLNMGPDVNTADEESAPYLAADDKTLYFSSRGYVGYGAMDIYVTRRLDDTWTKWSTPENLGPLINTERDDSFFNIPPTGEYGYFSRDFTRNNMDIFRFKLPDEHQPSPVVTIKGKVFNAQNDQPMSAKIIYESLPDGRQIGSIESDPQTGEFQILLPAGGMYGYTAEANNFIPENANIDLTHVKDFQERTEDLKLEPLVKGAVVRLNNIFFDFNKHELKPASVPELRRLMKIMDNNPNLKIQIAGHTDNVGRPEDNMVLSELRAKAVENYLVANGVSASRVSSVGFGQTRPIAPNDRELGGRAVNRRVEFIIVDN